MKFLIVSKQDSQSGADNYTELEVRHFKSAAQAVNFVRNKYDKGTKLYQLFEINVNFKEKK